MHINETKQILARVAAVDSRELSEAMAQAWHDIIGHIDYTVAVRAVILAQRDPQIQWIQPKHVLGKAVDATLELNRELRRNQYPDDTWKEDPQPTCKPHNSLITECDPCCATLSQRAKQYPGEDLHLWAVRNLYVQEVA